ncbi:MAG: DUF3500 domain-containing protein [Bacteroidetes bacterium]|nr:DUF3500 domain-containing protein [Bacteroidota bacterium]MCB0844498.1 DUF3500 domain-containing protein [Bacteroidota bacterium]
MLKTNSKIGLILKTISISISAICVIGLFFAGKSPLKNAENTNKSVTHAQTESAVSTVGNMAAIAIPSTLNITQLVSDATSFYNSLSSSEQSTLQQSYTATLGRRWSNLPCGSGCRNGIQLGSLTSTQLTLALQVIEDVLGTTATNGYQEYSDITLSEDALVQAGANSSQYNSGLRWLAFLNAPSETDAWMLQFGGHHYAANIAFNDGHVIGVTPFFVALEPATFTLNGTSYGPMEDERDALREMLAALSTSELATAKLSTTFSDCLMSPGESNGNNNTFPATKEGLAVSGLSSAQKALILAAIENYVEDLEETTAAAIMATYTDELDDTYIAYTGNGTSGTATSFLSSNSNYVRIDGPTVWIEFACQNGVVIQNQIHYHSVWRDHEHDYGVDLSGDAIDVSTGINHVDISREITIYPNPTQEQIVVKLPLQINNARILITDISGKRVYQGRDSGESLVVDVKSLSVGSYLLTISTESKIFSGKFIRH